MKNPSDLKDDQTQIFVLSIRHSGYDKAHSKSLVSLVCRFINYGSECIVCCLTTLLRLH